MVNITDFFGKDKDKKKIKSETKAPKRANTVPTKHEIIDLDDYDDDDDELLTPARKKARKETHDIDLTIPSPTVVKKPLRNHTAPGKKTPMNSAESKSQDSSVQSILAQIPSLDLSQVSVKENAKFEFGKNSAPEGADAPLDFPEGQPNCLLGLTIVFTGILPNLERGAAETLAKRYGARVTKSISSRTSLVVLGEEAGFKKVEKIRELGIKAIDEDGFRQLISGMPAEGGDSDAAMKARQKLEAEQAKAEKDAEELASNEKLEQEALILKKRNSIKAGEVIKEPVREGDQLWTVKYAPKNLQQICGNKSSVNKLHNWLENWQDSSRQGFKSPGKTGTGIYRAAMLYGPPGIGKTTVAHLVAKELGYDILEQNASDVRSKSLLNENVKNSLDSMSIVGMLKETSDKTKNDKVGKRFVIIMDEVDGMSGGDRGGVGQLAQYCRKTSTPMILICNERSLPKMRPFDRICLDIQFRRPDANSIKSRLMTIAIREKFKLDASIIDKLVQATRGDIRQIINLLSTISTTTKSIGHENIKNISDAWEKNVALKPFDIASKLLSGGIYTELGASRFDLNAKIGLYFDDFDFAPLMIQENYLNTAPQNLEPDVSHLMAVAEAADSISLGDLIEKKIRSSEQLWSLLPLHGVMSSVRPASKVAGRMVGRINFSAWLGQNSKTNKYNRILQELYYHTTLNTSTDKIGLRLNYLTAFKRRLLNPIVSDGANAIPTVIEMMDEYFMTKEDWDFIMELLVGNENTDALIKKIPTAVKSSFTRQYNSMTHPVAIYRAATAVVGTQRTAKPDYEDIVDADDDVPLPEDEEASDGNLDLKKDKLIKAKASKPKTKAKKKSAPKSGVTKKS